MIGEGEFLWVEKYRPRLVKNVILPDRIKSAFMNKAFLPVPGGPLKENEPIPVSGIWLPNMILTGPSGTGKTTLARAWCEEVGADYIFIRGSDERGIDTLRTKVKSFASTVSLVSQHRKVIIFDEADNLTHDAQLALRGVIEEFINNCSFIFTCNYVNRIVPAIQSRCTIISFLLRNDEKSRMAQEFFNHVVGILKKENVEFVNAAVVDLIKKYFPDYRRVLNELQRYAPYGKIDAAVVTGSEDLDLKVLYQYVKARNYNALRRWVGQHSDQDAIGLLRSIYDTIGANLDSESLATATILLGEYQYKSAFAVDQEINTMAFLSQLMLECKFK